MNVNAAPPAESGFQDATRPPPWVTVPTPGPSTVPSVGAQIDDLRRLTGSADGKMPASLPFAAASVNDTYVSPTDDGMSLYRGMAHYPPADGVSSAQAASHPDQSLPDIMEIPMDELRRHADYSHGQFMASGRDASSSLVSMTSDRSVAFVFATQGFQRPGFVVHLHIPRHEYEALVVRSPGIYSSKEKELLTVRILPHWIRLIEQVKPRHRP